MNTLFLAADAAPAATAQSPSMMPTLIMFGAIFLIMWLFMIRPQQKKQKEIKKFQNALEPGSKVVTQGGIYGTVRSVDLEKNIVNVEIAKGVVISVDKAGVFPDATSAPAPQK